MNWATQIAARLAKTASSLMVSAEPIVLQPPHTKPTIIVMTAPRIRPQMPYFTFAAVTGCIVPSPPLRGVLRNPDTWCRIFAYLGLLPHLSASPYPAGCDGVSELVGYRYYTDSMRKPLIRSKWRRLLVRRVRSY